MLAQTSYKPSERSSRERQWCKRSDKKRPSFDLQDSGVWLAKRKAGGCSPPQISSGISYHSVLDCYKLMMVELQKNRQSSIERCHY